MIDERHINQILEEASAFFGEADRRERNADDRSKAVADAHREGWKLVAKSIDQGFRLLADAVRERR